jgi:hypothetical protein
MIEMYQTGELGEMIEKVRKKCFRAEIMLNETILEYNENSSSNEMFRVIPLKTSLITIPVLAFLIVFTIG